MYYLTGNHDEMLRKFSDTNIGNFSILDKLVLELDDKKACIFYADVFDASVNHAKWITKLGGYGYDYLILMNRFVNWCLNKFGKEPYSFSKKIKASVKTEVKFISDFETTATDLAIENKYDYVICGHIHEPKIVRKTNKFGTTTCLNSGDWVENLTALEYNKKRWKLYKYVNNTSFKEEYYFEMETKMSEQLISALIFSKL